MEHSTGSPLRLAIMRRTAAGEEPSWRVQRVDELYRRSPSLAYLFSGAGDRARRASQLDRVDEEDEGERTPEPPSERTYSMDSHGELRPPSYIKSRITGREIRVPRRKTAAERLQRSGEIELASNNKQIKSRGAVIESNPNPTINQDGRAKMSPLPKEEHLNPRPCSLLSLPIYILQIIAAHLPDNRSPKTLGSDRLGARSKHLQDLGNLRLTCRTLETKSFQKWSSSIEMLNLYPNDKQYLLYPDYQMTRAQNLLREFPERFQAILGNIKGIELCYPFSNPQLMTKILSALPKKLEYFILRPEKKLSKPAAKLDDPASASTLQVLLSNLPHTRALKIISSSLPTQILSKILSPECRRLELQTQSINKELFHLLLSQERIENLKLMESWPETTILGEFRKSAQKTMRGEGGKIQMYRVHRGELWVHGNEAVKSACERFVKVFEETGSGC